MKRAFILFCFITTSTIAQRQITGVIKDIYNRPLSGVNINIKNSNIGTNTDLNGYFELFFESNHTTLAIRFLGYKPKEVLLNKMKNHFNITLEEDHISLDEVQIKTKSNIEKIKEKAFKISLIETKQLKNSNTNINTVLRGISGINIRQSGGVGSSFSLSMNGLSGKQIKFFIDGIPMDNLGSSLSLNNFPSNLINHIEVYKGVIPVELGADALGGAINIVSNHQLNDYQDFSYSTGSFNTHVLSFLGQHYNKNNGFTAKIASFINYSDNNFTIDNIDTYDNLGNINGTIDNVERFHDAYASNMIKINLGYQNRSFAKKLILGGTFSSNRNEIQHALDPQKPYGGALTKEILNKVSLNYENDQIFEKKLCLKIYGTAFKKYAKLIDTVSKKFYWYKAPENSNTATGEIGPKSLFRIEDESHIFNSLIKYHFTRKQNIVMNYTKNYLSRKGKDPIATSRVPFTDPHKLSKHVLGLSFNSIFFDRSIKITFFAKYFNMETYGIINAVYKNESDPTKYTPENNFYGKIGGGFAAKFQPVQELTIKTSFEKAYRLPEGYEIFGNGNLLLTNLKLIPEESHNYNLGLSYRTTKTNGFKFNFAANGFYRDAKNMIILQAQALFSKYLNKANSKIIGFELDSEYSYKNWKLSANITKQEITEKDQNNIKIRIPNIPLLYGNIRVDYNINSLFNGHSSLNLNWNSRYVDGYPLQSYKLGSKKDRKLIPSQFSQDFETSYSFQKRKYNVSLLISNFTNERLYDNFRIQQPGRAYYLKLRYAIP